MVDDGFNTEWMYGFSAIAMMGVLKGLCGFPNYRNEKLHSYIGVKLPDSSIDDQLEKLANRLRSIDQHLQDKLPTLVFYHADDTTAKIDTKKTEVKTNRKTGTLDSRYGCHSSVVLGQCEDGHTYFYVKTGIQHCGEVMDDILKDRNPGLPMAKVSWDRSNCNQVTVCEIISCGCFQHLLKHFKDQQDNHPKLITPFVEGLQEIFKSDALVKEKGYDRLAYRAEHSLPILDQLAARSAAILESKIFAPNSNLAQPFNYILRHLPYFKRTLLNADIDLSNNAAERAIAKLVLFRQAVHHFKNELGAQFIDIIWRVGFTAIYNDVNPFLYFTALQQNSADVSENAEAWLPWNYLKRHPEAKI